MRLFKMTSLSRLRRSEDGISAVEFALIAPFFIALIMGFMEVTFRYQASDKFNRFSAQAGDFFSRSPELTSEEIKAFFERSDAMMRPIIADHTLTLAVSSIGFNRNGEGVLLWTRTEGGLVDSNGGDAEEGVDEDDGTRDAEAGDASPAIDAADAVGLDAPGESVIRVDVTYTYSSPMSGLFGLQTAEMQKTVYYRPRVTRVIAIDGEISENGDAWDNGTDVGSNDGGDGSDDYGDGYDGTN